ncbi:MAG TPA: AMP-binding protein [Syntrophales bacterium]|nr:AMP-binding protein [Syntrophales bacterium]
MAGFFDSKEAMDPEERAALQDACVAKMAEEGYGKAPGFRALLKGLGIEPAGIRTAADLEKLPVISREKLVQMQIAEPPYGGLKGGDADVDRVFISPGPVYEPHLSETDHLWARAYHAAGFRKGDVVVNTFSYHMVAAGLTFHGGLRSCDATVVPSGTSGTQVQVELIRDIGVTGYTGTPSFLLAIIRKAEDMGYDMRRDFRLKRACFAAEPLDPSLRELFENRYGIETYQMYGATEVGDVAFECREKSGWHVCEEVLVEIVDPATGRRTPPGEAGEVVVTRFNSVFFLMRFGTGDLSRIIEEPCGCGRTSVRIAGVMGRIGDAVKVRGMFIAPSQLESLHRRFPEINFQAAVGRSGHADVLTVRIESDEAGLRALQDRFSEAFRQTCTVKIDRFERAAPGSLSGAKRLVDERLRS